MPEPTCRPVELGDGTTALARTTRPLTDQDRDAIRKIAQAARSYMDQLDREAGPGETAIQIGRSMYGTYRNRERLERIRRA